MPNNPPRIGSVPSSRLSRLMRLGGLATGIGGRALAQGLGQLAKGQRPAAQDLFLTPANAARVATQLSQMRGAAMKIGQLLSMDTGEFLPPQVSLILSQLRADADRMPERQLRQVLGRAWGKDWEQNFAHFNMQPIAAASIGQVHRVQTRDGRDLAIKVQYPGVRDSIDSDVKNLGMLLRLPGLMPPGIDLTTLLSEARTQLHAEADYLAEADLMRRYQALLGDRPGFVVPRPVTELTTKQVLAMDFIESQPIETLSSAPADLRDKVSFYMISLLIDELFDFNLMQTDPNFANFRWQSDTERIVLLDFGAIRSFSDHVAPRYLALLRAGLSQDQAAIRQAAIDIGYLSPNSDTDDQAAVMQMITLAFNPLRTGGVFDLAATDIPQQISDIALSLARTRRPAHVPPPEILFLHRKLGGLYLLTSRLKGRVDLDRLIDPQRLALMLARRG